MAVDLRAPKEVFWLRTDPRFPPNTISLVSGDGVSLYRAGDQVREEDVADVQAAIDNEAEHKKIAAQAMKTEAAGVLSKEAVAQFGGDPKVQKLVAELNKAIRDATGQAQE